MKSFWFVRHGETDWNLKNIYQGQNDVPLNANGRLQAQNLGERLHFGGSVSQIFTSPLLRARQTAQSIQSASERPLEIIEVPELMECKSEEGARYLLGKKGLNPMPDFRNVSDVVETPNDFLVRVDQGLNYVWDKAVDLKPLIVAHGGVCTGFCLKLKVPLFATPNCCLIDFHFENEVFVVRQRNGGAE